jgi:photosystem II stability/assembly factor-like uncharacterized protein
MQRRLRPVFTLLLWLISLATLSSQSPFWKSVDGAYGGIIDVLLRHPNGFLFAAARSNGIFRSTDNGTTWHDVSLGLEVPTIYALAVHPNGNIYAGSEGGGVYRSTNHGSSWRRLVAGPTTQVILSLAIDSTGALYAGTAGAGIRRSTDLGDTWVTLDSEFFDKFIYTLAVKAGSDTSRHGVLFAGIVGTSRDIGVYRSINQGSTWTALTGTTGVSVLSLHIGQDGTVFAGTRAQGVIRSTNDGSAWESYNSGLPSLSIYFVTSSQGELFTGTNGQGVYRRPPGGAWQAVNEGLTNRFALSLLISPSAIYVGTGGSGIYARSLQAAEWSARNKGLSSLDQPVLHRTAAGTLYAGSRRGGLFRSTNHGLTWSSIHPLFHNRSILSLTSNAQGHLFAGLLEQPSVYRSLDHGQSWTSINDGLTDTSIYAIHASRSGTIFAGANIGMYRLDPASDRWIASNNGLLNPIINDILSLDSTTVLAGTTGGIFRSSNDGAVWSFSSFGISTSESYINDLEMLPDGSIAAASDRGGFYVSRDSGRTWNRSTGGLTNLRGRALTAGKNGEVYLGTTGGGVFRSTDYGTFWAEANSGIGSLDIRSLIVASNGAVIAGTYRSGLYIGQVPLVSVAKEQLLPATFKLEQNFPNPFNPTTVIQFQLPRNSRTTLTVFSPLGQELVTIVDSDLPAGVHRIPVDFRALLLRGFSSGTYYYRLTVDGVAQARRMILLK